MSFIQFPLKKILSSEANFYISKHFWWLFPFFSYSPQNLIDIIAKVVDSAFFNWMVILYYVIIISKTITYSILTLFLSDFLIFLIVYPKTFGRECISHIHMNYSFRLQYFFITFCVLSVYQHFVLYYSVHVSIA